MKRRYGSVSPGRQLALAGVICLPVLFWGCSGPTQPDSITRSNLSGSQPDSAPQPDLPPTAKTLYAMADILATQGKDTDSEFVLRRCIQQYPQFTPAYNSLAELQMRQGRVNEAVGVLSRALQIRPRDPVLLNNLGMCRLIRKDYEKALAHFTEAAGLVPESKRYRANMATTLGLLGRHEESLSLLEQILPGDKAKHNAEILRRADKRQVSPAADAPG